MVANKTTLKSGRLNVVCNLPPNYMQISLSISLIFEYKGSVRESSQA